MLVGLVRRSDDIARVERQYAALEPICERIFEEQDNRRLLIDGRPVLMAALDYLSPGDQLVVERAQCLGPDLTDGIRTLIELLDRGFAVSVLDGMVADDSKDRESVLKLIRECTEADQEHERWKIRRGIQAAQERGVAHGRPRVIDEIKRERILVLREEGATLRAIAATVGVSVGTVHNVLADLGHGGDAQTRTVGID